MKFSIKPFLATELSDWNLMTISLLEDITLSGITFPHSRLSIGEWTFGPS